MQLTLALHLLHAHVTTFLGIEICINILFISNHVTTGQEDERTVWKIGQGGDEHMGML